MVEAGTSDGRDPFRSAFESAAIGMAVVDMDDGRWLRVNPPLCEMLGYDEDELLRLSFPDVTHPDDLGEDLREMRRLLAGEIRAYQLEKRYVRKDGTVVWGLLCASLARDADDTPVYGIAQVQDITEAKRAATALQESERLWRTVITEARENIALVDIATLGILESNPAFRDTLGHTAEELGRLTVYDIVDHDRESVDANVHQVRQARGGRIGERRLRRRDGSILHAEIAATPIRYRDREALCVIAHDVTERRQAQKLLESRIAILSRFAAELNVDHPPESMTELVARTAVEATTAAACSVSLVDPETRASCWASSYPPGERQAHGAEDTLTFEISSRGRQLGTMRCRYRHGGVPADERVVLEAVAAQVAVAIENARLFGEAQHNAALEERQRLARELHDSVSQALYGIALGARSAQALLGDDPKRSREALEYVLSLADAAMTEMRALILALRPESLATDGLVTTLEQQAEAIRSRHRLPVTTDLADEPDVPLPVKEALYRIAHEALHNTVKHAAATRVGLKLRAADDTLSLEVWDDGAGFDPSQAHPGRLGLQSMRERAASVNGQLDITSSPKQGTSIRVRIDPADAPARLDV